MVLMRRGRRKEHPGVGGGVSFKSWPNHSNVRQYYAVVCIASRLMSIATLCTDITLSAALSCLPQGSTSFHGSLPPLAR